MKRFFLAVVIFVFCLAVAYAVDYRVCIYPYNNEIDTFIKANFSTMAYDPDTALYIGALSAEKSRKESGEALHKALNGTSQAEIDKARGTFDAVQNPAVEAEPFSIVTFKAAGNYDVKLILSEQREYLDMICREESCELLIVPVSEKFDDVFSQRLYCYDPVTSSFIRSIQVVSMFSEHFGTEALLPLSSLFSKETMGMIHLVNLKSGADVSIDSAVVPVIDDCIIMSVGNHIITISSYGYKTRTLSVDIEANGVYTINGELEKIEYSGLTIDTDPEGAVIYVDEKAVGNSPIVLENYTLPLAIRAEKHGYTPSLASLSKESGQMHLLLRPQWMDDNGLYVKARNNFYKGFGRSILIFGAGVFAQAILPDDKGLATGFKIAASGLMAISITNMVRSLLEYYRFTQYTAP